MGMGFAAHNAWTISLENLKSVVPAEMQAIERLFAAAEDPQDPDAVDNWDAFAKAYRQEELPDELYQAWEAVQASFAAATVTDGAGLGLDIGFYDEDEGSRYDELETGAYFAVTGVTQLTPAGKRFEAQLENKNWVVLC